LEALADQDEVGYYAWRMDDNQIDIKPLSSNLYKFSHGVNNWLVLIGPDGVLLSDSGSESYAMATKENLMKLGNNNVKYIINTHWHHEKVEPISPGR